MTEERDKWIDFVDKLDKLTQEGTVKWNAVRPSHDMREDENRIISTVFEAKYKDRKLRLYEESIHVGRLLIPNPLSEMTGRKEPTWEDSVVLELIGQNGAVWTFPEIDGLDDLLESVKFQVLGVNDYVDEVLADSSSRP